MSIEELLKPRIICCEDYLNNKFEVGKLIPLVWKKEFNDWEYEDCSTEILLATFLKYKQFKELKWWQGRIIDEMPQYLKDEHGEIFKVIQYHNPITDHVLLKKNFVDSNFTYGDHSLFHLLPATEEEYIQYQQNKNVCQKKL